MRDLQIFLLDRLNSFVSFPILELKPEVKIGVLFREYVHLVYCSS